MKAGDITKIKKGKWAELGGKLVTRIVEDADKGISQDGDGDKFPPYRSKKYKLSLFYPVFVFLDKFF